MQAVVNLRTVGKFHDFLVENGMEFLVEGFSEIDNEEAEKLAIEEGKKLIIKLVFKGKVTEMLSIMTDRTDVDFTLYELLKIRGIIDDFFSGMQELSNGIVASVCQLPATATTSLTETEQ